MSSYPASPDFARRENPYESGRNVAVSEPPLLLTDDLPRRPQQIQLAVGAMIATAALGLIISAATFGALHHFNATYRLAVAPIGAGDHFVGQVETVVRATLATMATIAIILAIVQVALVSGVVRGNRGARMGAWALSAVGVGCAIASLLTMVVAHSTTTTPSSGATAAAVVQTAQDSVPGWFPGVVGLLALLQALGYIAAAILLATRSAGAFFGRIMRPWRPSV
jgi:hypothetical protein